MKKVEWLIAALFMGVGILCMTISAVSFQSNSLLQFGGYVKTFLLCIVLLVVSLFLMVKLIRLNRKSKE
ncbi:hypothetical protein [Paenibacillus pedocola]|uniref:hypothetical protein n=1 Tax=Paenibacillus pedocola TaxID=3242193 RepID=UPI0028778E78|nr:hypothetical protein [Paenibacillus typhae]